MTAAILTELTDAGVSIWLDDLDRNRLTSGGLARLVDTFAVRGVTTNPAIFEKAISSGAAAYAADIADCKANGLDVDATIRRLTTDDVRDACDVLRPVYDASGGVDGRVSIEVDPRLARDTEATIVQAAELWHAVDRPNLLVKIPGTAEGLPAITATLAAGISVNVTLIFSVMRYREVIAAFEAGLERAAANGHDLSTIESVASFFVSRVDTEIDNRLQAIGTDAALAMRGKAAIANARLAWAEYIEATSTDRWQQLETTGAHPQRPLWASTGVKDPAYDDTRYVVDLVAPGCVNTMPQATLDAVAGHGVFHGDTVTGTAVESLQVFGRLADLGINATDVFEVLETEGVQKFIDSWNELRTTVEHALTA